MDFIFIAHIFHNLGSEALALSFFKLFLHSFILCARHQIMWSINSIDLACTIQLQRHLYPTDSHRFPNMLFEDPRCLRLSLSRLFNQSTDVLTWLCLFSCICLTNQEILKDNNIIDWFDLLLFDAIHMDHKVNARFAATRSHVQNLKEEERHWF